MRVFECCRRLRGLQALVFLLIFCGWSESLANEKLALIVANKNYTDKVGVLSNPHKDAALMQEALEKVGYTVVVEKDLSREGLLTAVERHAKAVGSAGERVTSFFYYSGHGAAKSGSDNYIIPVSVKDASSSLLWHASVRMDKVRRLLREHAPAAAHIVVFDACRNELKLPTKSAGSVADKGFTPVANWGGMLVAYSTDANTVASDGARADRAGPYALVLAEEIGAARGETASSLFGRVRFKVKSKVEGQAPWYLHGLDREVHFGEAPAKPQELLKAKDEYEKALLTGDPAKLQDIGMRYQQNIWGKLALSERQAILREQELQRTKAQIEQAKKAVLEADMAFEEKSAEHEAERDRANSVATKALSAVAAITDESVLNSMSKIENSILLLQDKLEELRTAKKRAEKAAKARKVAKERAERTRRFQKLLKEFNAGRTKSFKDCSVCPEMALLPGGRFATKNYQSFQHAGDFAFGVGDFTEEVRLKSFAISRFEVTEELWWQCVEEGYCKSSNSSLGEESKLKPVAGKDFNEIFGFIDWLNSKVEGSPYRLPLDSEWEYAARAGTNSQFWWGEEPDTTLSNFGGEKPGVIEVGKYPPNPFGLFDISGNVSEVVQNCDEVKGEEYSNSEKRLQSCPFLWSRGGAYSSPVQYSGAFVRGFIYQTDDDSKSKSVGFRVARSVN